MITPGEGYRLLEAGEKLETDDEYCVLGEASWFFTESAGQVLRDHNLRTKAYRRKLPAAQVGEWVSFSERAPAKSDCPFVALFVGRNNDPQSNTFDRVPSSSASWSNDYYAWQSIPRPPTPPKSEAEIAWDKDACIEAMRNKFGPEEAQIKTAFFAGYKAGKGAAK